jgi:predicted dehydrogenase
VDYGKKVGVVVKKSDNLDLIRMASQFDVEDLAEMAETVDYKELLKVEELTVDDSIEPLRRQAEAFLRTVRDGEPPVVSARDGLEAVRVARQVVETADAHHWDGPTSSRAGLNVF